MRRVVFAVSCISFLTLAGGCDGTIDGDVNGPSADATDEAEGIRVGNFPGPDGPIRAAYELEGENALVGGDILWPVDSMLSSRAAAGPFNRWKNGIIPYDNSVNSQVFIEGVNAWNAVSSQTGVTFVRRTNQRDYLLVVSERRCSSFMGRRGGAQILDLVEGGCIKHSAIHELGHAIGLMHEHTRADRDSYIRFNWDNIVGGRNSQFARVNLGIAQGATNYTNYDFKSIMHYRNIRYSTQYLIDPSKPMFEPLNGPSEIYNKRLSAGDIAGVAAMYAGFGGGTTPPPEEEEEQEQQDNCPATNKCSAYGIAEGACESFGTGTFRCVDACLEQDSSCPSGNTQTFRCSNGQNIAETRYCDGVSDCNDGSDESSCGSSGGSSYGACSVGSSSGDCIDTSVSICTGSLYTGYCPGANEIRCCI